MNRFKGHRKSTVEERESGKSGGAYGTFYLLYETARGLHAHFLLFSRLSVMVVDCF